MKKVDDNTFWQIVGMREPKKQIFNWKKNEAYHSSRRSLLRKKERDSNEKG